MLVLCIYAENVLCVCVLKAWRRWRSTWLDQSNTRRHLEVAERHRNAVLQRRCLHAMASYAKARRNVHHNFGQFLAYTWCCG